MKYLPLTLIVTLSGSLLIALIFVPTLGALVGKAGSVNPRLMSALAAAEKGDIGSLPGLTGVYARSLRAIVNRAWLLGLVLLFAFGSLAGVWIYYAKNGNGVEFFASVEPENALIHVHARGNLAAAEKDALVREAEELIMRTSGIETVYARTGAIGQGQDVAADVIGTIFIEFQQWDQRRPAAEILDQIRSDSERLAGIQVEVREPDVGPPTGKDIQVELRSRFPNLIDPYVDLVRAKLSSMQGVIDVEDSRPLPGIQWEVDVDRSQAGRFGADVAAIGSLIQLVTNGVKVGEYRPDDADEEIDIRVRFPEAWRNLDQLDRLRVQTANGLVPMRNFVTRTATPKTGTLKRTDGERAIKIQANVRDGILPDVKVNELKAWLATQTIDGEVSVRFKARTRIRTRPRPFCRKPSALPCSSWPSS